MTDVVATIAAPTTTNDSSTTTAQSDVASTVVTDTPAIIPAAMPTWWRGIGMITVVAGAGVWVFSLVWFRRRVRRRVCTNDAWIEILREQCDRFDYRRRVRLTVSDDIMVPMAMGVFRPEICLPADADRTLPGCELRAAVAHELAHLHRRDPAWLVVYRAVQMLLFAQPLNRFAVRRLIELSEYQCDAWAAETTRDPLALARCLERVARRLVTGQTDDLLVANAPVASLAMTRSMLSRRVGRLLEPVRPSLVRGPQSRLAFIVAATMIVAVTMHVPGVQARLVGAADTTVHDDASSPEKLFTDDGSDAAPAAVEPDVDLGEHDAQDAMVDDVHAALHAELDHLNDELTTLAREWQDMQDVIATRPDADDIRSRMGLALSALTQRYAAVRTMVRAAFDVMDDVAERAADTPPNPTNPTNPTNPNPTATASDGADRED